MKTFKILSFFVLVAMLSQSCLRDKCIATRDFVQFNPVFMTGNDLSYDVNTVPNRALVNPGKIYFYENYLFINEQGQGVHIYDNKNPESPSYVTFYNLPGNFDIAIRNDVMYADNPLYLMAIDIQDIENPSLKSRNRIQQYDWYYDNLEQNHVIYYTRSNVVETIDCSDNNFNNNFFDRGGEFWVQVDFASDANVLANESSGSSSDNSAGVGGSNARFTLYDKYLYTVDHSSLNTWDLGVATNPEKVSTKHMGWGIETIFPYEDKLFIGSTSGMFIFDNSNPTNPVQTANFRHAQACDPVVVRGNTAYVTLRDGNTCNGFDNQLDVIDVTNLYNPKLIKSYDMRHPHGLAIRDNDLFICEGDFGLKVFDASDDEKIGNNLLTHLTDINAYDVISLTDEVLFLIGSDGFFQYDVKDVESPKLISSILVQR